MKPPPSSRLVAGCYQFRVHPGQVKKNLRQVEMALSWFADQGCQLLVLPEMWSCGFFYDDLPAMARETPTILNDLQHWCRQHGLVLVGSLPELVGDAVYNTSYVVDVGGELVGAYRKIHLFSVTQEHRYFARGSQPLVCQTQAGRLGVMTCYDLRFPELARRLALDGAEMLCLGALWPATRVDHWSLLLRARALENQLFVLGCNGCGAEGKTIYGGQSAVVSPRGMVLAEADGQESRILATLDWSDMSGFRAQIPCFEDRSPGVYQIH
ncbi:MAG TPA: carbon-nitrogen family hydrolase [Syntrophobacteraceae bacterium]|nr:carbon-nitrogen family hydrolase [Syntrophobacteraceae bacterium]